MATTANIESMGFLRTLLTLGKDRELFRHLFFLQK